MLFTSKTASDGRAVMAALSASQAVIEFTPAGTILTANANFLALSGYSLDEIRGRHHSLFCAADQATGEDYRRFWQDLANGEFQAAAFKRFGKGGRVMWLQATYNPIQDSAGKVVKVIKFASDITEAKQREIDFAGKVDAIGRAQAVIEFTTAGHVLSANSNFLDAMGYALSEIQGKPHAQFCDPAYAASAEYRHFWDELRRGRFQAGEFRRLGKGGREVFIQANYNPILDDTGAVVKIVKFATDVTDMVRRRRRNDELGQTIHGELGGVMTSVDEANRMTATAASVSGETSSVIDAMAAAAEELNQSVRDIADNMSQARGGVESVFKHAETANAQATTLNASAAAMTNVVTLIQGIAGQINLLALNASIESARAGDAGRGFAVVASEVKSLAHQAAQSTQTIAGEIANMQTVTNEVVNALGLISTSMNTVLENVASVASAIEQQNAVTGEITYNMQSAVKSVHGIRDSLDRIGITFAHVTEASEKVKDSVEVMVA